MVKVVESRTENTLLRSVVSTGRSSWGKISFWIYLFVPKIGNKVHIPVLICFKEHFNKTFLSSVDRETERRCQLLLNISHATLVLKGK